MLNTTCTLRRVTFAANSTSGEPTPTEANTATGVLCSIQAMSSSESRQWMRETGRTVLWAYLQTTASIKTQDRIVPDGGSYSAKVLSVIGPPQDEAGRGSHWRVPCELLEGGGGS